MSFNIAIIGASGYTGAELIRLIADHSDLNIKALGGNSKAGQEMSAVFPLSQDLRNCQRLIPRF